MDEADRNEFEEELARNIWTSALPQEARLALCDALRPTVIPAGAVLMAQGEPGESLYLIVEGRLQIQLETEQGEWLALGEIGAGDLVGELSVVEDCPRSATVKAVEPTVMLELTRGGLHAVSADFPEILDGLRGIIARWASSPGARRYRPPTDTILDFLSTVSFTSGLSEEDLRVLERLMRWVPLEAGQTLVRKGDPAEGAWLVVSGRLIVTISQPDGTEVKINEVLSGETVGELALIDKGVRSANVIAVRDCELLYLPRGVLMAKLANSPAGMLAILRILVRRLRNSGSEHWRTRLPRNFAVLGLGDRRPLSHFVDRLSEELNRLCPVVRLDRAHFSEAGMSIQALIEQEDSGRRIVLLEDSGKISDWSRFCIRQADVVLFVGDGDGPPPDSSLDEIVAERMRGGAPPRVELVLLHRSHETLPTGTAAWLESYPARTHHHVALSRETDIQRLARSLTGHATAVVLSGGGARGFAHIGVLRALAEAGVQVDAIAGTSMGSVIAAQRAMGWDWDRMLAENRRGWIEAKPMQDYTLPFVAMLAGDRFFGMLEAMFGGYQIEDLWISAFFATANLTRATPYYARHGELWRWISASMGFPGVGPPRILNGDYHCDGGVLDNLPVHEMRRGFDATIIAVDVGQADFPAPLPGMVEFPTSWEFLKNLLSRSPEIQKLPRLPEILFRAATMGADQAAEAARREADFCLRPPIQAFETFDFNNLEAVANIGYTYAAEQIAAGLLKPGHP